MPRTVLTLELSEELIAMPSIPWAVPNFAVVATS